MDDVVPTTFVSSSRSLLGKSGAAGLYWMPSSSWSLSISLSVFESPLLSLPQFPRPRALQSFTLLHHMLLLEMGKWLVSIIKEMIVVESALLPPNGQHQFDVWATPDVLMRSCDVGLGNCSQNNPRLSSSLHPESTRLSSSTGQIRGPFKCSSCLIFVTFTMVAFNSATIFVSASM